MSRKLFVQLIVAVFIISTPFLYQNCTASHGVGSGDFSSTLSFGLGGSCDSVILLGFEPYRDLLGTQALCANCHQAGGQAGKPFADSNVDTALRSFLEEGEAKIWDFALNPGHRAGFTGAQNEPILSEVRAAYLDAETQYTQCIQSQGGDAPGADGLPTPTLRTLNVAIPDATDILNNPQTLDFDLTELGLPGATASLDIQAFETDLGNRGYDVFLPTIAAGDTTVYARNLGIYINNTIIGPPAGSAFQNLDRFIAANTTRAVFPSGAMNITYNTQNANTISMAFEVIELRADVNFTPATYEQLVTQVFQARCNNCHSGANPDGGIDLSAGTYTLNYLSGLFRPFDEESQLLQSVLLDRMPAGAPLPQNEKDLMRGWILDGAPRD